MTTTAAPVSSAVPQTQPLTSVASSSSAGAAGGSVINVSSLVSQLVAATEGPRQSLIANQTQQVTTQISSLGQLKSALSTFQGSLAALDSPSAFQLETANSGAPAIFTATASSGAPAGTYNVAVSALATAQQLLSNPVSGSTIGTGTLQVSLGGASFSVTVDSSNDTLSGLAAAINSAPGNPGIAATVLQGASGAYLLLSSSQTGAANTIQVTETDGGAGLTAFTYGSGNTGCRFQHLRGQLHEPGQHRQQRHERGDPQPPRGEPDERHAPGTRAGHSLDRQRHDDDQRQHPGFRLRLQHAAGRSHAARRLRFLDQHRRHHDGRCRARRHPEPGPAGPLQHRQHRLLDLQHARQHRHNDQP